MTDKGKNECSKNICNNQKFTLVLTLKFKSGKTEKLKSQFKSKSSQGGCDLPNEKQFKRARKKLFDSWKNSQIIEGTTKKADALTGIDTRISHNSNDAGSSDCPCSVCTLPKGDNFQCGYSCEYGYNTNGGCGNNCETKHCNTKPVF